MDIGANIRIAREKAKMTRTELAERVDVTQSMISQLERGTKVCTLPLAAALAEALDCSVNIFVEEGGKDHERKGEEVDRSGGEGC